jgi:hypothetical protein
MRSPLENSGSAEVLWRAMPFHGGVRHLESLGGRFGAKPPAFFHRAAAPASVELPSPAGLTAGSAIPDTRPCRDRARDKADFRCITSGYATQIQHLTQK